MFDSMKLGVLTILAIGGVQGATKVQKTAGTLEVKLTLGRPVQAGPITIVPIESTIPLAREEYLTLAEASKLRLVEIVEMPGQEEVNSLEVRNKSKLPILLFAGELLLGGKQDRIVAKDSIIPGHERRDVPVFCVEHGRWDGKPVFESGDTLVADSVRSVALSSRNQSAVWQQVANSNAKVAAAPATGTIRGTLNDPKTKAASDKLLVTLSSKFMPSQRTVGVICCINGKIESADIFANPSLFKQSSSKLFHSYALDAALSGKSVPSPLDAKSCQSFLTQIVTARRQAGEQTRYGNAYLVNSDGVQGFESGTGRFAGGLQLKKAPAGGATAADSSGFSHGTYKPMNGKTGG